jgi:Tol biopolymer transport system component
LYLAPVVLVLAVVAGQAAEPKSFRGRILLIGTERVDDPLHPLIVSLGADGTDPRTVLRLTKQGTPGSGRVAPDGSRLAYTLFSSERKGQQLWLMDADGKTQQLADQAGEITAWSPDGQRIAYFRDAASSTDAKPVLESFVFDLKSRKEQKLSLGPDYYAEDWHPKREVRTIIYGNWRNLIYREKEGDRYPVRQLDLLKADGTKVPISKDPSFDNASSRFSPAGDRIAHYRRRFVDGKPHEYLVVCNRDGSGAKEVAAFTDFGNAENLYWFRPCGGACWSPDGKTLVQLVDTFATQEDKQTHNRKFELVFIPANGGKLRRVSLTDMKFTWINAIDWR